MVPQSSSPATTTKPTKPRQIQVGSARRVITSTTPAVAAASSSPQQQSQQQQPGRPRSPLECDYDQSPTELYQLIERQKWKELLQRLEEDDDNDDNGINHDDDDDDIRLAPSLSQQAAVWMVRKHDSGQLQWRRLPLHAALLSTTTPAVPLAVVEALLEAYPEAASQKDERGRLPLHWAMSSLGRTSAPGNRGTTAAHEMWQNVEELLTVYPAAIFSKDRQGKTPLESGVMVTTTNATNSTADHNRTVLNVLQLWTTIQSAGEKNTAAQQNKQQQQTDTAVQQLQLQHVATLEQLRHLFRQEQTQIQRQHEQELRQLQRQLEDSRAAERQCRAELEQLHQSGGATERTLRALVEQILQQEKQDDDAWQQLARRREEHLAAARRQWADILTTTNSSNHQNDTAEIPLFLTSSGGSNKNMSMEEPGVLHTSNNVNMSRSPRRDSQRSLADQILEELEASSSAGL